MELAKKDGETNVEERYAYPNLYAQGTSKHARGVQLRPRRSHQHIFEGLYLASMGGILASMTFPICATASTLTYVIGRVISSQGYATGEPANRYSSPLAYGMWYGMLMNTFMGMASVVWMVVKKTKE